MEIVGGQKKTTPTSGIVVSTLPLYRSGADFEVQLDDFELFTIDRLRVLKGIDDGLSRGKGPKEMEILVNDLWKLYMRHHNASEVMNKDITSHYALRLAYCGTEDKRKWFLSMETTLFRYRFRLESPEAQMAKMEEFNLPYKVASKAELEEVKYQWTQASRFVGQPKPKFDAIFFKIFARKVSLITTILIPSRVVSGRCTVPVEETQELLATRRVYIHKGYAYIAKNQVVSILVPLFRNRLSKELVVTNRKWTGWIEAQEENRLTPIIKRLSTSYLGRDYSQPKEFGEISIKDIDKVASSSFPLCMRHLFEKLREDHHLTYQGKIQLGLFLKGAGLPLKDALAFLKAEFSQKVGVEKFDQEHAYHIRHCYGKEGQRTDYSPYSCQKIISSIPGVRDHHGCPYRYLSEENLRAVLGKMGVGGCTMEEVLDKVRNRHYQLACTLTFEAVHGSSCHAGINHPNQYFSDSQKILQPKGIVREHMVDMAELNEHRRERP